MLQILWERIWTLHFLAEGVIPLLFWLTLYYIVYFFLHKLDSKGRIDEIWFHIWRHLAWFFYSIALYQPVDQLFPEISAGLRQFGQVFTNPLLGKKSAPSLLALLSLIPIFYFSTRLASASMKLLGLYFKRSRKVAKRFHQSNIRALLTLGHYILILLFFLFGINLVGINISSLGVLLGALGLGIGFGLQNIAANFVSGITLLLSGHIQHDDFIRTKGAFGTVERIGLMSTIVLTTEYQNLIIPNQHLLNEIIENASYNYNRAVQLHIPLAVAYESDLHQIEHLLRDIVLRNPYRPDKPQGKKQANFKPDTTADGSSCPPSSATPMADTTINNDHPSKTNTCKSGKTDTDNLPPAKNTYAESIVGSIQEALAPHSGMVDQLAGEKTGRWQKKRAELDKAELDKAELDKQAQKQSIKHAPKQKKHNKNADSANNNERNGEIDDVWLKGFGTSSIDFEVRMMIENIDVYRAATHWFHMEVWHTFKEHGITIPFAQLDVRLHDGESKKQKAVTGFGY